MNTLSIPVQGLIFDMDGTLVDNMAFHNAAWQQWFEEQGLPFEAEAFFSATAGRTNAEIFAMFMPHAPVADYPKLGTSKELCYQRLYEPMRQPLAGVIDLLKQALTLGLPCAVGTAAPQMNIDFILEPLRLSKYFKTIVNPNAHIRGKPHPDIFLEAARKIQVPAQHCIVFEDAPLGIQAAHNGGMKSVALTTHLTASELALHSPSYIAKDFTQLVLTQTAEGVFLEHRS